MNGEKWKVSAVAAMDRNDSMTYPKKKNKKIYYFIRGIGCVLCHGFDSPRAASEITSRRVYAASRS